MDITGCASLKLTSIHLTQYTLLVILASFFMNILLFLTRYLLFLNPSTHIFVNFDAPVYMGNGIFKTSIATSIVHSKLDYCNSLYYNLPEYQTVFTHPKFSSSCRRQSP